MGEGRFQPRRRDRQQQQRGRKNALTWNSSFKTCYCSTAKSSHRHADLRGGENDAAREKMGDKRGEEKSSYFETLVVAAHSRGDSRKGIRGETREEEKKNHRNPATVLNKRGLRIYRRGY